MLLTMSAKGSTKTSGSSRCWERVVPRRITDWTASSPWTLRTSSSNDGIRHAISLAASLVTLHNGSRNSASARSTSASVPLLPLMRSASLPSSASV